MSFRLAQKIAWRYIRGSQLHKSTRTLTKVCFLGIFIGTFSLTLQIFIMSGFEKAIAEKMQSIYPQITLDAPFDSSFDFQKIESYLFKTYPKKIKALAPAHSKRVIVQSEDSSDASAVSLRAIDPQKESSVSSVEKKLKKEKQTLSEALKNKQVIIGKTLAQFFDVREGDELTLFFTHEDEFNTKDLAYQTYPVIIGGIIDTGIVQYDKYLMITSHALMKELLEEETVTQIGITLYPGVAEKPVMKELEETFKGEANSWKTLYPALVSASSLEKYVMFFLFTLIALVAVSNLISLLFMHITQKKSDIAMLKALGMDNNTVFLIFILMGLFLTGSATLLGLTCSLLVGLFLQWYPFIKLPDVYYVTHLPVHIEGMTFLIVFCVVIILGLLATLFSARYTRTINITQTLRFDG